MPHPGETQSKILSVLSDGSPKTRSQIVKETRLGEKAVDDALYRIWKGGLLFRTEKPVREGDRVFKGRRGVSSHLRSYHLYVLSSKAVDSLRIKGWVFVKYVAKGPEVSKAKLILNFLKDNSDRAFYSTEVFEALKDKGIRQTDIMPNLRRYERKRLVYVRGYRTHDEQTPFKEGYLVTWIDPGRLREQALEEAVQRTNEALANRSSMSPIIERVHLIRDQVIEGTKLRDLVGFDFIKNRLACSQYEAEGALERALQLYPDLKEVKLFDRFRYYYHASISEEDLRAAIGLKENYVRVSKGRANRVGHNWEGVVEYFIDTLTAGAKFWTQNHRNNVMDPRRVTIHLMKPVGGRRYNAEVDRVWEVVPGPLLNATTYVLECKWGLIQKKYIDDFFEVLRWSKEFGVDTPDGRQVKQGVVGVFAGSAFNPKESVRLKDETEISLATYAARMNIQLLKASDFNEKLRERGVGERETVQRICRVSKDEKQVREILERVWKEPGMAGDVLTNVSRENSKLYEFEKMLEDTF